jgi:hypothetical protein
VPFEIDSAATGILTGIPGGRAKGVSAQPVALQGKLRKKIWRPQRDSNTGPPADHRRKLSTNRTKTMAYAGAQATGSDGSRRSTGTVRGQLRDSVIWPAGSVGFGWRVEGGGAASGR